MDLDQLPKSLLHEKILHVVVQEGCHDVEPLFEVLSPGNQGPALAVRLDDENAEMILDRHFDGAFVKLDRIRVCVVRLPVGDILDEKLAVEITTANAAGTDL